MTEQNGSVQSAPQPAPAAGQPGGSEFKVPDGHRLVKNEDWDATSRLAETGRGAAKYFSAGKSLGFEKPEDFQTWSPAFQTLKERGLSPRQIVEMFGKQAVEEQRGSERNGFDPERIKSEIISDVRRESAESQWRSGIEAEKELVNDALRGLESDAPVKGKMLERAFRQACEESRGFYPDGHPLAERALPPLTKASIGKVVDAFKQEWTKEKAESLAGKADSLKSEERQRRSPTTAAPNTGSGKADTKTGKMSRDEFLASALQETKQELGL